MKCPHCDYEDESYGDDGTILGNEGGFFKLSLRMEQPEDDNYYRRYADLFGCPSCNKTFIERSY